MVIAEDQTAIQVENLHKSFRDGKEEVLKGVSARFQRGKLTYILGSSGAGKSVLLKHVLGLLRPNSGKIYVEGTDISQLKGRQVYDHLKRFGMLFQNSALFDDMTVYENVAFPLREHTRLSRREIDERVKKTLGILGMTGGFDKLPNELSGGMRKRVGLARAIIREPSILLYDEPTTGLDPVTRTTVDELIETLKRELKLTSIVISHDLASALLLADEIAFLYQGQIVFFGSPEKFREDGNEAIQNFLRAERRVAKAFGF